MLSKAVLIAGPTASGKSALALELAQKTGGVVINADSMQVYRDLRIITARPTPEEEGRAPHRLYGHVDAAVNRMAEAPPDRRLPALSSLHGIPLIDAQMTVGRRKKRRIDSYLLAMTNKVADNVLDFDRAATLEIPEHRGCQR